MTLNFDKEISDSRGKIIFLNYKNTNINIVEIKKGFARGGHYHKFDQLHFIISGKILYKEKNLLTNKEKTSIVESPSSILIPSNTSHLFEALEDTVFAETYKGQYEATYFSPYRDIVEKKMKDVSNY